MSRVVFITSPGLSLALLPSGWTLFEREGSSSVLPLSGLSLSLLSIVTSPPGSPGGGVPKEFLSLPSRLTLFERKGSSLVLPLSGLSMPLLSIVTSPPGSPGEGVPKEFLSPPLRLTLFERKGSLLVLSPPGMSLSMSSIVSTPPGLSSGISCRDRLSNRQATTGGVPPPGSAGDLPLPGSSVKPPGSSVKRRVSV